MSDKEILQRFSDYLDGAYRRGRWSEEAEYIGKNIFSQTEKYVLAFIELGGRFIEQSSGWKDYDRRFGSIYDPFQFYAHGGSRVLYGNSRFKKSIARAIAKCLQIEGLPYAYNSGQLDYPLGAMGIRPQKIFEKEVPKKVGFIFRKTIMVKETVEERKTKEELILELQAFAAS